MKIRVEQLKEHLISDPNLDTTLDITDHFINVSVRCIETNALVNRSINIKKLESIRLDCTQYIMDEMGYMKSHVRGNY